MSIDLCSISDIRALLEPRGFRFSKSMGQNFLIERRVPERIAEECGADKASFVLEIGPGVGCLTRELSYAAGKVAAVELDRRLPEVLAITLSDRDNVEIVSGDVLKLNIREFVEQRAGALTPRVCANLPYNITTPVLTALLDAGCFKTVTVMIQREVAKRICAAPGSSDYGAFTVYANWHAVPKILFDVPPGCFMPAPKVTSSVVRLDVREAPPTAVRDEKMFFRVVRAAFAQRRKTLVNGLMSAFGDRLSKNELSDIVTGCGFPADVRGETLGIPEFAKLSDALV